jgi:hypothetical protein
MRESRSEAGFRDVLSDSGCIQVLDVIILLSHRDHVLICKTLGKIDDYYDLDLELPCNHHRLQESTQHSGWT